MLYVPLMEGAQLHQLQPWDNCTGCCWTGNRVEELCQAHVKMTHHFKSQVIAPCASFFSSLVENGPISRSMEASGWWCSCMVLFQFWPLKSFLVQMLSLQTFWGDASDTSYPYREHDDTKLNWQKLWLDCFGTFFGLWLQRLHMVSFQGLKCDICSMVNHILSIKKFCTFLEDNISRKYSY